LILDKTELYDGNDYKGCGFGKLERRVLNKLLSKIMSKYRNLFIYSTAP